MTHWLRCLIGLIATLLIAEAAIAQQARADPIVTAIDSDGDGKVSAIELKKAAETIRRLDSNKDGTVSRDEVFASENRGTTTRDASGSRTGSRLGGYTTPPPANNVPKHSFDIIVGRLTDRSATVRVLCYGDADAFLSYRSEANPQWMQTAEQHLRSGQPFDFVIESLAKDTRYRYRFHYKTSDGEVEQSDEYTFHTQRAPASAFVFTAQADSHLDENTSGDVYLRTLANALADQPDFHFALGDTFMTGKYAKPELSHPQYLAQRYYLGHLCHSAALYFALGNHDGESGNRGSNVWATTTRKRYLPNPFPDGFFTGNEHREREVGLPENYYQFEWGDCQFIVLDPFRHTTTRNRGGGSGGNWFWTLGDDQYQWLKRSLEQSDAKLLCFYIISWAAATGINEAAKKRPHSGNGVAKVRRVNTSSTSVGPDGASRFISCW